VKNNARIRWTSSALCFRMRILTASLQADLKQTIIDLDFADDLPNEDREGKYKRHYRFLRSLREDTLLIVDNFNATEAQDPLLDVVMKYRCRILFTTRSRYDNRTAMEIVELNPDILCELMMKYAKTAFYGDYDFLLLCDSESDIDGLIDEFNEEQTAQRAKLQRQPKSIQRRTQNQER